MTRKPHPKTGRPIHPALPPIEEVRPVVVDRKLTPPKSNPFAGNPNLIEYVSTDYANRPAHRGHTLEIQDWGEEPGMLIIRSDDRTNECLVTPSDLRLLADALEGRLAD